MKKLPPIIRNCLFCNKTFSPPRGNVAKGFGFYCSQTCEGARRNTQKEYPCSVCGEMVIRNSTRAEEYDKIFCSNECSAKAKTKSVQKPCGVCGKLFTFQAYKESRNIGRYCSRKCTGIARRGKSSKLLGQTRINRKTIICQNSSCGKPFEIRETANTQYCSIKCKNSGVSLNIDLNKLISLKREGKTNKEIGEILGCSASVVSKHSLKLGLRKKPTNILTEEHAGQHERIMNDMMYIWNGTEMQPKHNYIMERRLQRKLIPGESVKFLDGDKTNFLPDNLILTDKSDSYVTWECPSCKKIRQIPRFQTKLHSSKLCRKCAGIKGEDNVSAILTEKEVKEIRALAKENQYSRGEIAIMYKVSTSTVNAVVTRQNWKHVP